MAIMSPDHRRTDASQLGDLASEAVAPLFYVEKFQWVLINTSKHHMYQP